MQPHLDPTAASEPRGYSQLVGDYEELFSGSAPQARPTRRERYRELVTGYFNVATDFYLAGWGRSFHFAPRRQGERLRDSIVRYERFIADELAASPGAQLLDLGCGVGGPMLSIAGHLQAQVTGVNNNAYQLAKARGFIREAKMEGACRLLEADFMSLPLDDASCDGAYSIEAVPHAPDKLGLFRETFRVLRPGGRFVATDWCLTERFQDTPEERVIRDEIERGNGLPGLMTIDETLAQLEASGFEVVRWRDLAADAEDGLAWYGPLVGQPPSLMSWLRAPWGRRLVTLLLRAGEFARIMPRGVVAVQQLLSDGADALVAGGRAGFFSPLVYWVARKPN